jgi:predicted nucleotidyltransferase
MGSESTVLDKTAVLGILERFRAALAKRGVKVSLIVLYGSYATGRQHEGSDIDVVVVSDSFEGKRLLERVEVLSEAIYEVWEPIEAVAKTPREWEEGSSLIVQFAKQGEVVYRAKSA